MTENDLQKRCFEICERNGLDCLHIKNESGTADRRALGMRKGVPDLFIVSDYGFMFIELKRNEKLKPSEAQSDFLKLLTDNHVLNCVCGSEKQFMRAIKRLSSIRTRNMCGIAYGFPQDKSDSVLKRVSKFYLEKQATLENPSSLFALKLFTKDDKRFPWLCNLEEKYFVATTPSTITTKLIRAGWDVCFV